MNKIKVCLLLNSHVVHTYESIFILDILSDPRFEVAGVFLFTESINKESSKKTRLKNWIWKKWSKYFLLSKTHALKLIDLSSQLSEIHQAKADFISDENNNYFACHSTLTSIANLNLDVMINCQRKCIRGEILSIPKMGVWSFSYDNEYPGNLTGFWDVFSGKRTMNVELHRLTDTRDKPIILRKGWFATDLTNLYATMDNAFFGSVEWIKSALNQIYYHPDFVNVSQFAPESTSQTHNYPSNYQMLIFFIKIFWRRRVKALRNFFYFQTWNIGIVPESIDKLSTELISHKVQWLPELPWPYFQADPFGIETKDGYQVFLEEYNYQEAKGKLKVAAFSKELSERSRSDLSMKFQQHHSYPFVFNDNDKHYIMPECLLAKQPVLYQVIDESGAVKEVATLLNGLSVVDPSLLYFNNRYWIFCTLHSALTDDRTSLYLFHSESLTGPYEPHALNPVKSDVRASRPAGDFFFKNGKLHRPTQDCSRIYGGAITILEIDKLTPTEFSERIVDVILPQSRYPLGLHTITPLGKNLTLIDGKRYAFSLKHIVAKFIKSKASFVPDLTKLLPINQELTLASPAEFKSYASTHGIYVDSWCGKQVEMYVQVTEKIKNLFFEIEFPAWQSKKFQFINVFINNKLVTSTLLYRGSSSLGIVLPSSDSPIKISLQARREFSMPFPDGRKNAFRICKMNFQS